MLTVIDFLVSPYNYFWVKTPATVYDRGGWSSYQKTIFWSKLHFLMVQNSTCWFEPETPPRPRIWATPTVTTHIVRCHPHTDTSWTMNVTFASGHQGSNPRVPPHNQKLKCFVVNTNNSAPGTLVPRTATQNFWFCIKYSLKKWVYDIWQSWVLESVYSRISGWAHN